ncbi:ead/Ea22-like family protein [Escherichia coli]|uniref:ead/Ea22-like family protein n=1 Tax=Escherichia coli TaxID=562 RepID=UPI0012A84955|nr:ead/Ea22-like family protein [Escherichia coli]QGF19642.1 hypothetical protein [Escherichia phage phiv142-3]HAM7021699.1 ead/Ea22-like family protein [Escherichia coli]HAW9030563.1 ead/Ea22-like family protein [Escherichia coli]
MESNIKGLVAAGHEMASELKAECGAVDMRSVAKLISDLATQLEVQLVRANALAEDHQRATESIKQADSAVKLAHEKFSALAAENARLKAGAMYFSYGSEFSFECHKTAEEAIAAAEAAIDDYRGDACDGWSEEVESICWGVIIQQATKVGERKKRKCDRVSPWIERVCDYELRPNVETPATDAFLAEVRAEARNEGINYTASRLAAAFNHGFINKSLREVFDVTRMILSAKEELANELHPIDGLSGEYAEKSLEEWAEQIRKGVQS